MEKHNHRFQFFIYCAVTYTHLSTHRMYNSVRNLCYSTLDFHTARYTHLYTRVTTDGIVSTTSSFCNYSSHWPPIRVAARIIFYYQLGQEVQEKDVEKIFMIEQQEKIYICHRSITCNEKCIKFAGILLQTRFIMYIMNVQSTLLP